MYMKSKVSKLATRPSTSTTTGCKPDISMLAELSVDAVSTASGKVHKYLESQVQTIAHGEFDVLAQLANDIDTAARTRLEQELEQGRKLTEAKAKLTRRKEFSSFRDNLLISLTDGRRAMQVFKRFEGWSIDKLLTISSVVNLYTLCQSKFDQVVEQLRETAKLTKEIVKNLVKKTRGAARSERKKKQQDASPVSGWKQDPSGGGRHYQLPPMYNEEVAMKIEALAEERGIRAISVVEEAVITYSEQPTVTELKSQHQEEMQAAVTEMRDEHIRMQREIIELKQLVQTPKPVERSFSSWTEFADAVECDASDIAGLPLRARSVLLGTVKTWLPAERQALATLLALHLSEDQNNLDQVAWVPEKLLHSALSKLSFCVSKISGPDNMIDEPEIEHINGCRFVSVQHLGIRRPLGDARRLDNASCSTWAKPKTALDSPGAMDV